MTIAEILSNEDLRQQEFPVTKEKIFLSHAAVCPLPRRVSEAVRTYASQAMTGDQETFVPPAQISRFRQNAAKLLNVEAEEVAFVGPTSLALSFVAGGLEWKRGDNVLVYFDDYPSNVYPWLALAEKGVQVRLINIRELGKIRDIDIIGQVDESTRLVALASCHFVSGWRLDVESIGKYLRKKNILFCLDSIQTLGAFPTPLKYVDFAAADAHKWLLGPCAAGVFYVRKEVQDLLKPTVYGWHNVYCPNFAAQEEIRFYSTAQRYEAGSENLLGIVALNAAIELLLEVGVENIAQELLRKRSLLVPALQGKGYTVLQADAPPTNASGIVTFYREGTDMAALHKSLDSSGVVTSLRMDRSGNKYIRLSPHFYNTDAELQRALELL